MNREAVARGPVPASGQTLIGPAAITEPFLCQQAVSLPRKKTQAEQELQKATSLLQERLDLTPSARLWSSQNGVKDREVERAPLFPRKGFPTSHRSLHWAACCNGSLGWAQLPLFARFHSPHWRRMKANFDPWASPALTSPRITRSGLPATPPAKRNPKVLPSISGRRPWPSAATRTGRPFSSRWITAACRPMCAMRSCAACSRRSTSTPTASRSARPIRIPLRG